MQFTLQTLLLSFVVVASALAAFDGWGLLVGAATLAAVAYIRSSRSRADVVIRAVVVAVIAGVTWFLLQPVSDLRDLFKARCRGNRQRIVAALYAYRDEHGSFPPPYVLGPDGKPWHSWRTLLLPYLGRKDVYDQYRFDEPWDGPNNRKLATPDSCPFWCLVERKGTREYTNYVAVVGPQTLWPEAAAASSESVADRAESTIVLVEIQGGKIGWSEPRDLSFAEFCEAMKEGGILSVSTDHQRQGHFHHSDASIPVATADGHARLVDAKTPPETWQALLTHP